MRLSIQLLLPSKRTSRAAAVVCGGAALPIRNHFARAVTTAPAKRCR